MSSVVKQLLKTYRSLPFIIFKKKFLIPQAPKRPKQSQFTNLRMPAFMALKSHYPHIIDEHIIELKDNNREEVLVEIYQKEYKKERQLYLMKLKEYMEMYVKPLKSYSRGIRPQFMFFKQNKAEIFRIMTEKGIKNSFKVLYSEYKLLDSSKKQIYEEMCIQAKKQGLKKSNEVAEKCMIPENTYTHPHFIYLRQTCEKSITKDMFKLYKALPEQIKQQYRMKSRILKMADKKNLEAFLLEKNLNLEQFQFIKKVCEEVEIFKEKLKKSRKAFQQQAKVKIPQSTLKKSATIKQQKQFNADKANVQKTLEDQTFQGSSEFQQWKKEIQHEKSTWVDEDIFTSDDLPLEEAETPKISQKSNKENDPDQKQ